MFCYSPLFQYPDPHPPTPPNSSLIKVNEYLHNSGTRTRNKWTMRIVKICSCFCIWKMNFMHSICYKNSCVKIIAQSGRVGIPDIAIWSSNCLFMAFFWITFPRLFTNPEVSANRMPTIVCQSMFLVQTYRAASLRQYNVRVLMGLIPRRPMWCEIDPSVVLCKPRKCARFRPLLAPAKFLLRRWWVRAWVIAVPTTTNGTKSYSARQCWNIFNVIENRALTPSIAGTKQSN